MPKQPGITFSGPFFEKDIHKTVRANIRALLEGLEREGAEAVRQQASSHRKSGRFVSGVIGRVNALSGRRWQLTAVISEQNVYPWPSGGQKGYRGGKLEAKYHMFRRVTSALRNSRAQATADLVKGLE